MDMQILYWGITAVVGIGGWFMRNQIGRIDMLEQQMQSKVTEPQVRQVLNDKIEPLKEDIREIKESLKLLLDLALTDKKSDV